MERDSFSHTDTQWVSVADRLPETGKPVLAYFVNEFGKGRRIRAFYAPKHAIEQSVESDWFDYDETSDVYWLPEGWYENNEFEETHWHVSGDVTHWMELPEGPNACDKRRRFLPSA